MKLWNVGDKEIQHLYNNKMVFIKPNSTIDVGDDMGIFLLNRAEVRGSGLVELRDGDNKAEIFKQGKRQIYQWAMSKYNDFLRHCEEREAQRLQPLNPHKEIIEYKNTIDDYEKWLNLGEPVKEEYQEVVGEKRIFVCPNCLKEFSNKEDYFKHIPEHAKETIDGNIGVVSNTGKGKS